MNTKMHPASYLRILINIGALLVVPLPYSYAQQPVQESTPGTIERRQVDLKEPMVWSHVMGCWPLNTEVFTSSRGTFPGLYPAFYPLMMGPDVDSQQGDVEAAVAAGLNGFAEDVFHSGNCLYYEAADKFPNFFVVPCLDLSMLKPEDKEAAALRSIVASYKQALRHPSAAWVGDALLMFTFGTHQMPAEAWGRVKKAAEEQGCKIFFVADMDIGLSQFKEFPKDLLAPYVKELEGVYLFQSPDRYQPALAQFVRENGRFYCEGLMPGYFRYGLGYRDPKGTESYREQWEKFIASGTPWISINTWNDVSEASAIQPTSDWNFTRAELTYWYSQKLKKQSVEWTEPHLYITTTKAVYEGEKPHLEALVLNPTKEPVRLKLTVKTGDQKPVGEPQEIIVAPGKEGVISLEPDIKGIPAGQFLRGEAEIGPVAKNIGDFFRHPIDFFTAKGVSPLKVQSAPIMVLNPSAQSGFAKRNYYSIPAHYALPEKPVLEMVGGPLQLGGKAESKVSVDAKNKVRFNEILHNTFLLKNTFAQASATHPVPASPVERAEIAIANTEWGFYVGRVTDEKLRVGYSDPIYVAPPDNTDLLEKYSFDEGTGKETKDSSIYRKVGILYDVEWVSSAPDDKGSFLRLNGKEYSTVVLPGECTPTDPFTLKMKIRPIEYGAMLFCDTGGFWIEVQKNGVLSVVRGKDKSGAWVGMEGKTVIPKDSWTLVIFVWDGTIMRLFVNDQLEAELPWQKADSHFESFKRHLGCNPFLLRGSDFYKGDIDDFEIQRLPAKQ